MGQSEMTKTEILVEFCKNDEVLAQMMKCCKIDELFAQIVKSNDEVLASNTKNILGTRHPVYTR